MKKIVFTGGHHNSALVVAKILKQKGHQVFWFGHKHTMREEKSLSLELIEVRRAGIPFIDIKGGKFAGLYSPAGLVKTIFALMQSFFHLLKIRPCLIVSFGGYLSFPVVLAGKILGVRIIIHEQTVKAGLANRVLAPLAHKVLLTWPSSKKFFKSQKTELIGMPLPPEFFQLEKSKAAFAEKLPLVFVTGGKQGSSVINQAIEEKLTDYLKRFNLVHQSGGIIKTGDYQRLLRKKKSLSFNLQKRYLLVKHFSQLEMVKMLKLADLIISRSGAHIVYELAALARPSILIPFPWSPDQEQRENAEVLRKAGMAVIIRQDQLTANRLYRQVLSLSGKLADFKKKSGHIKIKQNAAMEMVKIIKGLINGEDS